MAQQASLRQLAAWTWRASRGVRGRVIAISLLGILRVVAGLCFVWMSKLLIDAATDPSTPDSAIWQLTAVLVATLLLETALSQVATYIGSLTTVALSNRLRYHLYGCLLFSDAYTDRKHSGDILNRLISDVGTVVGTVVSTLPSILVMLVQLCAAFWLLCRMSPLLAVSALVITPLCILVSKVYLKTMRRINAEIRDRESRIHSNLQEGLQHRVVVQTLECAPEMRHRLRQLQWSLIQQVLRRTRINLFSRTTMRLGFLAGYLIAFVWSVFQLHAGAISFGIMTAFLQLVSRIQGPISSLSSTLPSLVGTTTAIDRLMELEGGGIPAAPVPPAIPAPQSPLGIRLSHVTFRYSASERTVLSGFSHDFRPGSKTVVMGETGVGKSTLTKLVLALLHPVEGQVEVYDGAHAVPASAATRQHMVYVPQGNSLLAGTIRDNLLLGNPTATDTQLREVLHTAVADFVYELPQGLDTPCGELGMGLSEGQCQRIAIARALLRNGSILILDEFNSSLDTDTAAMLMERITAARPSATIIFISHRTEVASHCDDVLRLGRHNDFF